MADIYDMTDTWNDSGTAFTAIKMDVTNTASASGSNLLNLLVGGSSKFLVSDSGGVRCRGTNFNIGFFGTGDLAILNDNAEIRFGVSTDVGLARIGAGIFGQRSGTAAQASRIYNTYDGTNNEWAGLDWKNTANIAHLRSVATGTGTKRPIAIDGYTKAGAPTTSELPAGSFGVFKDSGGGVVIAYNDGGSIVSAALT